MPKPVILVAPLDWGLGHTTRCIPIIKHLLHLDCEVVIACNQVQRSLLSREFSRIRFVHLRGYDLLFAKNRLFTVLKIIFQIPQILARIRQEKKWLDDFMRTNPVSAILSDNRYGMYSNKVPSVFITHQLAIKTPFGHPGEKVLAYFNYRLIEKFSACWVPDFEGSENLAGRLSHPAQLPLMPVKYIGVLSRFYPIPSTAKIKLLILLSGPEPQRSIFENRILQQLDTFTGHAILVRGLPAATKPLAGSFTNLQVYNHLSADKLNSIINESVYVLSRPGYSTIMDVFWLKKKCIFVPTPGQFEQEYLAGYLSQKSFCVSYDQGEFCLESAIREAGSLVPPESKDQEEALYKEAVNQFIAALPIK